MADRSAPTSRRVHDFRPTNGAVVGYTSLVVTAVVIILVAVSEPTLTGLRVCLGFAIAGLLVWMTLLRPRAAAYEDTLVLRNMASDTHVPLARVDDVVVGQTLNVWVGDDRHVCAGIGRTPRSMAVRRAKGRGPFGAHQPVGDSQVEAAARAHEGTDYATFVETTIVEMARAARRDAHGEPAPVRRFWAVPELSALGVLAAGFGVTLLL